MALLSLLARKAATGYDLSRGMRNPLSYFYRAAHSQIYPELAKLERGGLVTRRLIRQSARPDKKVYSITNKGRERLTEWLSAAPTPATRDLLMLKAFSLWLLPVASALKVIEQHAELAEAQLAEYKAIRVGFIDRNLPKAKDPEIGNLLTLGRGVQYESSYLDWCEWATSLLRGKDRRGLIELQSRRRD
jgi:DNA-binding PadR family transcriptional regulator